MYLVAFWCSEMSNISRVSAEPHMGAHFVHSQWPNLAPIVQLKTNFVPGQISQLVVVAFLAVQGFFFEKIELNGRPGRQLSPFGVGVQFHKLNGLSSRVYQNKRIEYFVIFGSQCVKVLFPIGQSLGQNVHKRVGQVHIENVHRSQREHIGGYFGLPKKLCQPWFHQRLPIRKQPIEIVNVQGELN
ncbi:hypothetical protein BpHYR1_006355 [Brachionus plicatilis]|uniref:Uncharacterized protein n=1 Tax=Brachionus plicatilis TaxID=10195 RepID=A0A3M7S9Q3_BRAPC|nr:hypothetical protein BpHYR1_006355 [Brachionus plicatilis]